MKPNTPATTDCAVFVRWKYSRFIVTTTYKFVVIAEDPITTTDLITTVYFKNHIRAVTSNVTYSSAYFEYIDFS